MYNFCTYFNRNFIAKGLALYNSLTVVCPDFKLWILCLDDTTYEALKSLNYKNILLIKLSDFEKDNPDFLAVKNTRNTVEYYWTATSVLIEYILFKNSQMDILTYLDADLYFFSDPQPIYSEFNDNSIMIIPHRLVPRGKCRPEEQYGFYNVGMLIFRNNQDAKECLYWWKNKCLEWCYDRAEKDRYGDQKYLDEFPKKFKRVHILSHLGANVAPWNIENYKVTKNNNDVFINQSKLIFFHFSGLKIYSSPNSLVFGPNNYVKLSPEGEFIYKPYLATLEKSIKNLDKKYQKFNYKEIEEMKLIEKIKRLKFIQYGQYFIKKLRNL
jgi:hypothetical protein